MAGELLSAVALILLIVIFGKIIFGSSRPRAGGGGFFLGALTAIVSAVLATIGWLMLAAVAPLARATGRGAGSMWQRGVDEAARRAVRHPPDPDGLEDLWRRS